MTQPGTASPAPVTPGPADGSGRARRSGPVKIPPAVLAQDKLLRARRTRWREFRRLIPAFLLALVLHIAGTWWVLEFLKEEAEIVELSVIKATLDAPSEVDFPPEPEELPPDVPEEIEVDPQITNSEVESEQPDLDMVDMLGLGGAGGGSVRARGVRDPLESLGSGGVGGAFGRSPFQEFVDDVRQRGLDVVFVVDATASMGRFIEQARATIDDIVADLSEIVPGQRVGIVAYRDHDDAWVTRSRDLGSDRYVIHNFLLDLRALGGGDFEEAVDEGLRVAFDELEWRSGARRIAVLVGDAPVHKDAETRTVAAVRNFARDRHSRLSVLFTVNDVDRAPTAKEEAARAAMERLARAGGGFVAQLGDDRQGLRDRILMMAFGREWFEDIKQLLARVEIDRRQRVLDRKIANGDREWLLAQMSHGNPGVVNGLVQLFDRSVAEASLALLVDDSAPRTARNAALFIIKKALHGPASIDFDRPLGQQQDVVADLQRRVGRLKPKTPRPATPSNGRSAPPLPPGGGRGDGTR